jgi:phosphoribosylaminoimidazole carboxylase PurE protein
MAGCLEVLADLGIPFDLRILSAHRTPRECHEFAAGARGAYSVVIAAAGGAAHLAGAIAAETTLPVIGVPLATSALGGKDALLSTVQMPPGVPVATVAVGEWGATNAAVLAAQILALSDKGLAARLSAWKEGLARKVLASDRAARSAPANNALPALERAPQEPEVPHARPENARVGRRPRRPA